MASLTSEILSRLPPVAIYLSRPASPTEGNAPQLRLLLCKCGEVLPQHPKRGPHGGAADLLRREYDRGSRRGGGFGLLGGELRTEDEEEAAGYPVVAEALTLPGVAGTEVPRDYVREVRAGLTAGEEGTPEEVVGILPDLTLGDKVGGLGDVLGQRRVRSAQARDDLGKEGMGHGRCSLLDLSLPCPHSCPLSTVEIDSFWFVSVMTTTTTRICTQSTRMVDNTTEWVQILEGGGQNMPELGASSVGYLPTYPSLPRGYMPDEPQKGVLLTPQEAADLLGVSRETIRRAIRAGDLKATRLGYRTVRVTKADLDEWIVSKGGRPVFGSTPKPPGGDDDEKK